MTTAEFLDEERRSKTEAGRPLAALPGRVELFHDAFQKVATVPQAGGWPHYDWGNCGAFSAPVRVRWGPSLRFAGARDSGVPVGALVPLCVPSDRYER